jgi:DNA-binding MarR family transcriptional regulator
MTPQTEPNAAAPSSSPGDGAGFETAALARVQDLADDLDLDTFAASFNLFRVSTKLIQDLEANVHRPLGLSIGGFRVLFTVFVFGELEPREIAHLAGVTRAAVSGVLNTLERDALVERTREQDDRRLITVRLTEEGERVLREAYRRQNRREQQQFTDLSRAELRAFSATMSKLMATRLPPADDAPT